MNIFSKFFYYSLEIIYPFSHFPTVGREMRYYYASTLKELGLAMIDSAIAGYEKHVLEVMDIVAVAKK